MIMGANFSSNRNALVLIGFMGCGKTTIGIKLSYRLCMSVEDTDKIIEKRTAMKISDIFAKQGEEAFRDMETNLLKELAENKRKCIFSTGGGTAVREENRKLLKQIGTVVYLRIRPQTVYQRLKNDTTRPLLQGEDPLQKIYDLMNARKECYEAAADIIIDVDELSTDEVADKIVSYFEE